MDDRGRVEAAIGVIDDAQAEWRPGTMIRIGLPVESWRAVLAALRSTGTGRSEAEAMRERCAAICDSRAAYFDRAPGFREWKDAARSYRATAGKVRAIPAQAAGGGDA